MYLPCQNTNISQTAIEKAIFHNNLPKIHIKLHEIANFLEELQSKQALGGPGTEAPQDVTEFFIRKLKNVRIFGRNLNIFIGEFAYFEQISIGNLPSEGINIQ